MCESGDEASLLDTVDLVGGGGDVGGRVPDQVELGLLLDGVAIFVDFFVGGRLVLALDLGLLLEGALEGVAVLEEPDAFALRLVVRELALKVEPVGVNPLAGAQLGVLPLARHLHARLLEQVGAVAGLLAVLPPARVDVAVLVGEDALTVAAAVLPVAVELANAVVQHLADALLAVCDPLFIVLVTGLVVTVDAAAFAAAVEEVAVVVRGGTGARVAARARFQLVVLSPQLILFPPPSRPS